jgi:hypothetical protein
MPDRREYLAEFHRDEYAKQRGSVLDHYGRDCACCGAVEQLEVDHIGGGGNRHREEIPGSVSGAHLYRWLIRQGFPHGFQVLCRSCNRHKAGNGRCWLDHSDGAPSYETQARARNGQYRINYNNRRDARIGYRALHLRVRKAHGRAADHPCEHADGSCSGSMQWANISGDYRGIDDFMPLCRFHHRLYDHVREATVQDLSDLLGDPVTALAPTSQAGGNQVFSNEAAHTAPGSLPASPATTADGQVIDHAPPKIAVSGPEIPPGTDGKRQAKGQDWSPPGAPAWKTAPASGS